MNGTSDERRQIDELRETIKRIIRPQPQPPPPPPPQPPGQPQPGGGGRR